MKVDRYKRISEEIKKIVSSLLMYEIKDPRIPNLISVTHVDTTRDLRFATIYVSVFEKEVNPDEIMKGLQQAKGFIRKEIGKELKLHYTPEPIFKFDESIKNSFHINEILHSIHEKENKDE